MTGIPRPLVANLLGVDESTLPPGDLPVDRLAAHLLAYLRDTADDDPSESSLRAHPKAWAYALTDALCANAPEHALTLVQAAVAQAAAPDDVAMIAAGPLEDLLARHGADVIAMIETLAKGSARMRFALSGVWPEQVNPMVWARVEAARAPGPELDAGDAMPPA
ncbi:hypothetical protein M8756_02535 [Lutimaribacter sp. EGI FJ00015]|uniref:Uncharacterized protein n=1 Tax=Lutimaribacter degradans TaxID=2945989 RepID=A0ACC5ZSG6_9RHOB|nr:hypothetical protein [Lutimaribacter sp. EGI FJ00013]MCM2560883.1 hypothetical protein [Lutimaribacter sp. EGI FJ00013]MCO0612172.1 hypothetical protein [Lutimaribacter sp. EGI FJ00015]